MSALSGIDIALWDLKGMNAPDVTMIARGLIRLFPPRPKLESPRLRTSGGKGAKQGSGVLLDWW